MANYRVAVIPGDGIGKEVVPEAVRVLDEVGTSFGISFDWHQFPWSCETYLQTGKMMPEDGIKQLRPFDAIFLGAVGYRSVPDHISLWGLLIPIRRRFQQYVNLRPIRLIKGVRSPLSDRSPGEIDFYIVRENSEGEYSQIGGRIHEGTNQESVVQNSIFTRKGVDRILRFAFELARKRDARHVTSATKSNGIFHSMPYWDERFAAISAEYPDIRADKFHIDILSAHFVQHPDWFDVVVASNLFGDILSDLGAAVVGGMGLAPAANINPEREYPSMFEPMHGSAPDIAGQGIANPIAQIWTGAMMLEHLGHADAAAAVERAIESVLSDGKIRTADLGGNATTEQMGKAIVVACRTARASAGTGEMDA
jgi:tartrate dehydrogenase/decarboxylase/D-malate dehydrogenase